jgi:hypothetical protein
VLDQDCVRLCRELIDTPIYPTTLTPERIGVSLRTFTPRFRRETRLSLGMWRQRPVHLLEAMARQAPMLEFA